MRIGTTVGYTVPLTIVPDAGDVLMCNFEDLRSPEMTKTRRVIVLSPRARSYFPDTFLVVPVSKTPPSPPLRHHCEFKPRAYDFFDPVESVWALANMLTCVKKTRLDRIRINNRFTGACLRKADLLAVRKAVLCALGMETWREIIHTGGSTGDAALSLGLLASKLNLTSP
jgi:uncharacterized protein YifN (PemK superfamily)